MTGHNRIPTVSEKTPCWKFWEPESGPLGGLIFGALCFAGLYGVLLLLGVPA